MSAGVDHNRGRGSAGDVGGQMKQAIEQFSFKSFGKALFHRFQADNVTGLASQVAYSLIYAIPPLILLLVTLAAILNSTTGLGVTDTLHRVIATRAPSTARPLLDQLVTNAIQQAHTSSVSIGAAIAFVLAIYGASGGIGALMNAFNRAYEVRDQRGFVKSKGLTLALTLLTGVLVIAAFVLPMFAQTIGSWVATQVGLGSLFTLFWNIGSWVLAALFIILVLASLYYFGPDVKQDFRWISPGSVVATILWIVAIVGFKLYLLVSNPASGYGAAGSVIVLLTFLWVTALIFILGAEINAVLQKRYAVLTIRDLARHPEKTTPEANRRARQRAATQGDGSSVGAERPGRPVAISMAARREKSSGHFGPAGIVAGVGLLAAVVVEALTSKDRRPKA